MGKHWVLEEPGLQWEGPPQEAGLPEEVASQLRAEEAQKQESLPGSVSP